MLAIIGDQFGASSDQVCGAVISNRKKSDKVALWTRDAAKQDACKSIGYVSPSGSVARGRSWLARMMCRRGCLFALSVSSYRPFDQGGVWSSGPLTCTPCNPCHAASSGRSCSGWTRVPPWATKVTRRRCGVVPVLPTPRSSRCSWLACSGVVSRSKNVRMKQPDHIGPPRVTWLQWCGAWSVPPPPDARPWCQPSKPKNVVVDL